MSLTEGGRGRPGIRTPDQRLRVFVSSTLEELAAERVVVQEAIEQLRLTPVMFESGARAHPPQELYRAYLEQSDLFIGIYWQRYGWVAPGMAVSGLEDELRIAAPMPRLLYVKGPAPDQEPGLGRMLAEIRAEGAVSYKRFTDAAELRDLVTGDLAALLSEGFGGRDRAGQPGGLPVPVTELVGRDADVERVAGMLAGPRRRLVVLTGAGGAGKTRLALAVAEHTKERWTDGSAFVDLSAVADPSQVPEAIVSALRLVGQGQERPLDTLRRSLAGRDMLIVLDNFEQVLDAAPVVADLLQAAPGLRVVVTSRVVLRVRGEQEWRVDPLGVPPPGSALAVIAASPAVRLLVDRVRGIQPGFTVDDENAEAVAELCRRLDGLPLALELAAASMRLLTPQEVLERLPQRLDRPGALADLPSRQQTLAAAIGWSYDLLPPPAQRMLAQLSVFAAPFTAAAAEAVCSQEGIDAVQDLSTLVDHSMVSPAERADGRRAFRLLYPIRRFAAAQLTDPDPAFDRLERYLLDVLGDAGSRFGSQGADLRRLDSELPNLSALLSWALRAGRPAAPLVRALVGVWVWLLVRGHLRDTSALWRQIAELLARREPIGADPADRAWLLAGGWTNQGQFTKATRAIDEVLPDSCGSAETSGSVRYAGCYGENRARTALLLMARGVARSHTVPDRARADFIQAVAAAHDADHPLVLGYVQAHYGALLYLDGDLGNARALHEEALATARRLGDENLRAEAHDVLALDAIAADDAGTAASHLAAAVRHYRNLDHFEGLARCLGALSALAVQCGSPCLAAYLIGTVWAVRERFAFKPWPYVIEAERTAIEQIAASLSDHEFDAQTAAGRSQSIDEALAAAQPVLDGRCDAARECVAA